MLFRSHVVLSLMVEQASQVRPVAGHTGRTGRSQVTDDRWPDRTGMPRAVSVFTGMRLTAAATGLVSLKTGKVNAAGTPASGAAAVLLFCGIYHLQLDYTI